jgi:hypothetical protein
MPLRRRAIGSRYLASLHRLYKRHAPCAHVAHAFSDIRLIRPVPFCSIPTRPFERASSEQKLSGFWDGDRVVVFQI